MIAVILTHLSSFITEVINSIRLFSLIYGLSPHKLCVIECETAMRTVTEGSTYPRRQAARETHVCTVAPCICGSSGCFSVPVQRTGFCGGSYIGLLGKSAESCVTDSLVIYCSDFNRVNYRFLNEVFGVTMHGEWNFETIVAYILQLIRSVWKTQSQTQISKGIQR